MLGSQDCLPSVSLIGEDGTLDSCRWHSQSADWKQLKSGTKCCPVFYHMLLYQATRNLLNVFQRLSVSPDLASTLQEVRYVPRL
mmetsp:Transcript_30025/g.80143  ORF Transcript_30025/g.80143 Transcript_30025/m.80143 type:complete len:84 (+) Transcript_30025:260-511(+)